MELLKDQYGFRPTGSTCCAMVDFIHHSTLMLENNSYIRCLFIDFSKAFDVGRHSILLSKISSLNIPPMALKTPDGRFSDPQPITSSIVQGSGIGPTLWLIMDSDLQPLSDANVIFKYADDTNLLVPLVPENTDCNLAAEFSNIKRWADTNGLIINLDKTKELVLHRPHVTRHNLPQSLTGIEQVTTIRLLVSYFKVV